MDNDTKQFTKKERRELRRQERAQTWQREAQNRLIKRITLWSLVVVGVGGVIFGVIKLGSSSSSYQPTSLVGTISASDWTKGNKDAKVILVEYSDFQCPACGGYYPIVKQLNEEFKESIQFIYRHFPLKQIHPNAELAARSAEAAGKQNKFWEMHDLIFENQNMWSNQRNAKETFVSYAQSLGLDIDQFQSDLNSKEVKEKVENDYGGGLQSRVNSTPTFFLNGEKIQNPRGYEEFRNVINQTISTSS